MNDLHKTLGTWEVLVAGVALVVAASTLVSDFTGFFTLGGTFAVALGLAFIINLLLGLSAAELAVAYPQAGSVYNYARALFGGRLGRFLGAFLGLSFVGMFAFASSGEIAAGAFGLQALLDSDAPISVFIVVLSVLAVLPNLFGIRTTAWVSAGLLLLMLGIRWSFGIAGFLGLGATGAWSAAHLDAGVGVVDLFGDSGILTAGLALAFWSFVGIEFACSLAEEVKVPEKALPRGLVLGLVAILATSLVMGLGVTGTAPVATWQGLAGGDLGCGGDCPQLAVGQAMFGEVGHALMALASVAATLGTLTVAYAAMPRLLYSIARDGQLGPLSAPLGQLHAGSGTPVVATLVTLAVYLGPALYSSVVIDWLYSAAYVWIVLYLVFHGLALLHRRQHPHARRTFGRWFAAVPLVGIALTLVGLYFAFAGAHLDYGLRALVVLAAAGLLAAAGHRWAPTPKSAPSRPAPLPRDRPSKQGHPFTQTSFAPESDRVKK